MTKSGVQFLKPTRLAVSLIFFALTGLVFLDFTGSMSSRWMNGITFLQFLPSVLKFWNIVAISAAGFVVVILITVLFGRVYCSTICPLGTYQDIFTFVSRKIDRRRFQRRTQRYDWLRFGLLAVTVIALIAGSSFLSDLLDPFSSAGRIFSSLVRPVLIGGNNALAYALEGVGLYALYPAEPGIPPVPVILCTFAIAATIGWLAFTRGRLYCNMICPVGAFLGLLSRCAVYRVAIDQGDCKGCGLCEKVCKAGCIDRKTKSVDFDRCIGCFNCFEVCPRDGMMFKTPWKTSREPLTVRKGRREFISRAAGMFVVGSLVGDGPSKKIVPTKAAKVPTGSPLPVSPPGSRGLGHFTATCTACHLCVSACPSRVLQPSFLEYGVGGILQPRMDYRTAYCNYECTVCGDVCPSGAILALPKEQKKLTQLGIAKFVKDNCIVNTEHTDCGACSEHCPTKAVSMIPFEGKLVIPEVRNDYCIGCGACEHACPTRPFKAIYVESNRLHATAKKPPEQKMQQPAVPQEDFPF